MADDAAGDAARRPATRGEIVTKMTTVPVFNLVRTDNQQAFPTVDNPAQKPMGTFYFDFLDAETQLRSVQALNPHVGLAIEVAPLSHAWALSERWVDQAPPPGVLRLQASKAVLASLPGFPELPEELRAAFNPLTSRCPLWQLDALHTVEEMPYFFHYEDLVAYWAARTGQPADALPDDGLDVTDLRVLVARMSTQPEVWERLRLIPPRRSMELTSQPMPGLAEAVDAGSEPPPLEGDEPPPLEGDEPPKLESEGGGAGGGPPPESPPLAREELQ
jgi:hypothetical protein